MNKKVSETNKRSIWHAGSFEKSLRYALQGICRFFHHERNGRLQVLIAIFVFLAGIMLSISIMEWLVIILFTSLVISMEMFNSALEKLCDKINPEWDTEIKVIKDMAAGAVLWTSLLSIVAGLCIFIPKIIELI